GGAWGGAPVAPDGGFIPAPVPLDEVVLGPGERAEALVQVSEPGRHRLLVSPFGAFGRGAPADGAAATLVALDVPAALDPVPLPASLATVERLDPARAVATRRIVLDGGARIDGPRFRDGRAAAHAPP